MELTRAVGENIKRIHKSKKLSMERTAAIAGVSRSMLGQIERGEANPSVAVVGKLALALKVPAQVLLENDAFEPLELVRELDGVKSDNDAIGTSPSRTVACLESFPEPVILIAGGYDKGVPFHALALEIRERVKTLVLTGDTARAIRQAGEEAEGGRGCPEIIQTEDLAGAVEAARRAAGPGDVVVLSPACAAFDRFKNFMERGRAFTELVRSL